MENEAMPKEILGVRPDSGMFNQANMEQAYLYYNSITRARRSTISEVFSMLLQNWETPIQTDAAIKEQSYASSVQTQTAQTPPQGQQINEALRNLTGRQLQNIQRIVRKFNQEQLTYEQAKQMLINGYGFTDTDVADWLVTPEEDAAAPPLTNTNG